MNTSKPYKKYYIYWAGTDYSTCSCCYDDRNYILYFLTDIKEEVVMSILQNYIEELKKDEECDLTDFLYHLNSVTDGVLFQEWNTKEYNDRVSSNNVIVINLNDYSEEEIYSGEKLSAIKRRREEEERKRKEEEARKKKEAQERKEKNNLKAMVVKYPGFVQELLQTINKINKE